MRTLRLSRRTVLKGAGSIAIALPWLEVMSGRRTARAAAVPARRFLAVYTPGGTVRDKWTPTGTESAPILSPILAPLEPVKDRILIVDGVDMKSAIGEQSQSGMVAWLTGTAQKLFPVGGSPYGYASGPSIDQVLATRLAAGRRKASIQLAIRWGTGKAKGLLSPIDAVNYEDTAAFSAIPPAIDPVKIWQDLFGTTTGGGAGGWDKSMLDFVDRRYVTLAGRLGAADKQRLEQHLTNLRGLEKRVGATAGCIAPKLVDTTGYNPQAGLQADNVGAVKDIPTDLAIPKVGKLMMDMMVMAFACDLTAVGTLQWSDCEAKHTFPWLNLPETHAFYQNDGGYKPIELAQIYTWYASQHAYLLQELAKVDVGGHSLLDESVVFFGSEVQHPATHFKDNMPFLLAGGGGGLRGGRWVKYSNTSHNNLLVALLNLFGDTRTTFGTPAHNTGALANLT